MPSPLRHLFPRHKDNEGKLSLESAKSPKWPKFPRSPRSPKSPKPLTYAERNPDRVYQCQGCNHVENLITRRIEQRQNDREERLGVVALLHNSFDELDQCAHKCATCRVFRQSLILEEVTFDGVWKIHDTREEVFVRWNQTAAAGGTSCVFLTVGIEDAPGLAGVVNCNSHNDIVHLALHPDGRGAVVVEQAKRWLNTCLVSHIGECDNLKFSSENPELLIEILSSDFIRLCENQTGGYVALSYCWGDPKTLTKPELEQVNQGKTVMNNVKDRLDPFAISDLPATVRDALQFFHAMGLRYAWIDYLCIVQDNPKGVATMHKVYSNALFTLCSCATTRATSGLFDQREAWTRRTEPCRLGGQWLTTSDMSVNELRLRSPLAGRAWTLQEERLSPRMLYVSSSRMYWSCAKANEMELKPVYEQKATKVQRPVYATTGRNTQMPLAQEFLLACRNSGSKDLHTYWADIVKSYALRSMTNIKKDRLNALSGLAAKYASASSHEEYLAGLWKNDLPADLVWKVDRPVDFDYNNVDPTESPWPSWSWAALPLQTVIETNVDSTRSSFFDRIADNEEMTSENPEDNIKRGETVKDMCVTGRIRPLWGSNSRRVDWTSVSRRVDGEERFSFAATPEQNMHAIEPRSGRVLVYEDRKTEIVGQLDFWHDVEKVQINSANLTALEIGETTMLLLEHSDKGAYRRVGVAWHVRKDFFAAADHKILMIR
ncbi:HET-domain-containing protein [Setomelanomma holmii]|uniref:HET-domain-containing protein n=1 Tax=Setomelanomma holmii TaxID=210430 RepID=A0A9P4LQ65_9PLEO|nr:HET-domain-containing protein [Setomelanomma holmii]